MKNRWIALLLALVLMFSMLPTAFALDTAEAFETDQKLEAEDIPCPEGLGAYTDGTEPAAEEAADDMLAVQQSAEEPLPELPELTREELVPLDALIQGLPLAPPKEPEPVDDDLLVCDETMEIFDVCIANYKDRSVKKLTAPLSGEQRAELQKQFLQLYLKAKDRAPLRN